MSSIKLESNASGTGIFTIASPNSNTNRTLTLPDNTGTINTSGGVNEVPAGSASAPSIYSTGDTNTGIFFPSADTIAFAEGGTECARFNSGGYFKASNSGTYLSSTGTYHELRTSAADTILEATNTNASTAYGIRSNLSTYFFNTTSFLYDGLEASNLRFRVYSNGGIANYSGNNSNLSDEREKKNIELAPNYLDKICQIPVKTFLYNNQPDTDKTLGVIAQDVQAVSPELVMESNWGTQEEPKMRLSIYQTDLQYALMKCIQELSAKNDALEARLAALENT